MRYLPTAFAQLQFAWKLHNLALEHGLSLQALDVPLKLQDEKSIFVLPDRIFHSEDDLISACENFLTIAFGAAAITLNRSREEAGLIIPAQITSETDQCVALAYQLRNAFAHDIAEPRWEIRGERYLRRYCFGPIDVDLRDKNGRPFEYEHIGGPEALFWIYDFATKNLWPEPQPRRRGS